MVRWASRCRDRLYPRVAKAQLFALILIAAWLVAAFVWILVHT